MIELRRVVLHDYHTAVLHVLQQSIIVSRKFGPGRIRSHAEQNLRPYPLRDPAGDVGRRKKVHFDSQVFQ